MVHLLIDFVSLALSDFQISYLFSLFFTWFRIFLHIFQIYISYVVSFCIFFQNFSVPLKNFVNFTFISYLLNLFLPYSFRISYLFALFFKIFRFRLKSLLISLISYLLYYNHILTIFISYFIVFCTFFQKFSFPLKIFINFTFIS